ncbi:MAG TPA: M2 family metallopeptidase [Pirellulales bacterium]|nr:M2 family metallopeptidase [Pirellulales bacterium]
MLKRINRRLRGGLLMVAVLAVGSASQDGTRAQAADEDPDTAAAKFLANYDAQVRPLEVALGLAWWKANTTGKDEDFAAKIEAQNRYDEALANRARFAELKALHKANVKDPILAREVDVLYRTYLEKQVEPELLQRITTKSNDLEKAFNAYRAKVEGREIADSEVRRILKESKDSRQRQAVWESSKEVGRIVADDLKQLVFLRNEAARKLGFKSYHAMRLFLSEQDQQQVLKLFDELDTLTRQPFAAAKGDIDLKLAAAYGVGVDELRPWHYHDPFFQESPAIFDTSLDKVFAGTDILALCRRFYEGIGLPIDDVLARSDLYEKSGKSPHAFCTDIDREGDVRVLANIVPNEYWTGTMLHELGHAVYSSKNIPRALPYPLRTDAHILCTEGVAMMFERFSKSGEWLEQMGVSVGDPQAYSETGAKMRRNQLLIFSRWCQVVLRFEQQMYDNPEQNLNRLWWDLVEKYQMVKRPEGRDAPDYASKIHIATVPAYYHNYMMGQLFACQLHAAISRDVLHASDPSRAIYTKNPGVGAFMNARVFSQGARLSWNELTKHATGQDLNPKAFAAEFGAR